MRLVVVSDTHGLHHRIESLPAGDILVHAGDFMNSGYDTEDILSFDRWLGIMTGISRTPRNKLARFSRMLSTLRTPASRSAMSPSGGHPTLLSF
jgi:3',5'-cyclic AMP phosphodiesterase CpdA